MTRSRLEAFSDAVIAIIMTIMVLELDVPEEPTWDKLRELDQIFVAYILSFVYLGIYWNNHHHMFHLVERITGGILWANLHLLFWLSLFPFATDWMGHEGFAVVVPMAFYGIVQLGAAIAYYILQQTIIRNQGQDSKLAAAVGRDMKGKISPVLYVAGIASSFLVPEIGLAFYFLVALMWLIPDRRIEVVMRDRG